MVNKAYDKGESEMDLSSLETTSSGIRIFRGEIDEDNQPRGLLGWSFCISGRGKGCRCHLKGLSDTPEGQDHPDEPGQAGKVAHGNLTRFKTKRWCCTWVGVNPSVNPGWA